MAAGTIVVGVFGCVGYFYLSNKALDVVFPPRGANAGHNINKANAIRPWLFLGPSLILLSVYLLYPVIMSIWYSVHDAAGRRFRGP